MAVKMTFSLDEETAARLRQASEALLKPKSEIVREAIHDYAARIGKLSEVERQRMLQAFDTLVPAIPYGAAAEADAELERVRRARRDGGRRSRPEPGS